MSPGRRGLTLVEMLVVTAIIGLLIAMLLPAVQAARESARRTQCGNNFRQACLGVLQHVATHDVFPAGETISRPLGCGGPIATGSHYVAFSWATRILPYVEMNGLAERFDWNANGGGGWANMGPMYAAPNTGVTVSGATVSGYLCPSDAQADARTGDRTTAIKRGGTSSCGAPDADDHGRSNILGVSGTSGWCLGGDGVMWPAPQASGVLFNHSQVRVAAIHDGTSQTLLLAESTGSRTGTFRGWSWPIFATQDSSRGINGGTTLPGGAEPCAWTVRSGGYASYHPGGCHVALADSSVRFVSQDIAQATLDALATRGNREIVGEF